MMTRDEARQVIRRILSGRYAIIFKGHPEERAAERGFNMQDIQWVIGAGCLVGEPKQHKLGFECAMRGFTLDKKCLKVPIIVDERNLRFIIKSVVPQRKMKKGR